MDGDPDGGFRWVRPREAVPAVSGQREVVAGVLSALIFVFVIQNRRALQ